MAGGECRQVHVVVHKMRQVRFGEDILHPLFEGEVVDTASFGDTVRQEPKNKHSSAHVRFHIVH